MKKLKTAVGSLFLKSLAALLFLGLFVVNHRKADIKENQNQKNNKYDFEPG